MKKQFIWLISLLLIVIGVLFIIDATVGFIFEEKNPHYLGLLMLTIGVFINIKLRDEHINLTRVFQKHLPLLLIRVSVFEILIHVIYYGDTALYHESILLVWIAILIFGTSVYMPPHTKPQVKQQIVAIYGVGLIIATGSSLIVWPLLGMINSMIYLQFILEYHCYSLLYEEYFANMIIGVIIIALGILIERLNKSRWIMTTHN